MKCPILEIGWMQTKVGDKGQSSDCIKEECAWWSLDKICCSFKVIAVELTYIQHRLKDIARKLPGHDRLV